MVRVDPAHDAEVLLAHIIFLWTTYLLVPYSGHYWVFQPRRESMKATGLTLTRYKHAIEVLTQQGEIESFITPRPYSMTHLRLLKRFTDLEEIPFDSEMNPQGRLQRFAGQLRPACQHGDDVVIHRTKVSGREYR